MAGKVLNVPAWLDEGKPFIGDGDAAAKRNKQPKGCCSASVGPRSVALWLASSRGMGEVRCEVVCNYKNSL